MTHPLFKYPDSQNHLLVSGSFWGKNQNQRTISFSFFKHLKELANFVKEPVKTQWGFMAVIS